MARNNPIGKIKDTAVETISATIKDPVGTAKLAVGQVVGTALSTAAVVTDKVKGSTRPAAPKAAARPEPVALAGDEPVKKSTTKKATTKKKSTAKKTTKSTAKKSTAKRSTAKKSPAQKTTTKKATSPTDGETTPLTVVDSEKD